MFEGLVKVLARATIGRKARTKLQKKTTQHVKSYELSLHKTNPKFRPSVQEESPIKPSTTKQSLPCKARPRNRDHPHP